jgi:hypothetical protein
MKTIKSFLMITTVAAVFLGLILQSPLLSNPQGDGNLGVARLDSSDRVYDYQNKELERFFAAKAHVFKRDWTEAVAGLEKYLEQFPRGEMRDEALYWLAMSQNRLSRENKEAAAVVRLKEEALENLGTLIDKHPSSLWTDDARALRIEIQTELVLLGKKEYEQDVREAARSRGQEQSELTLVALDSLIRMKPEAAVPALTEVLQKSENPTVRKRCVLLLGRNYSGEVLEVLHDAVRNDSDAEVRKEAQHWVEQIQTRLIPVELSYYAFATWADEDFDRARVPEGKLSRFALPPGRPGAGRAQAAISRFFDGTLARFGSTGSHRGVANLYTTLAAGSSYTRISHRINDFQVHVVGGSIKKQANQISGEVQFQDLKSRERYTEPFTVNDGRDALFAMRRGEQLAVMLLQFENRPFADEADEEGESGFWAESLAKPLRILSQIFKVKKKPVYYTEYGNWMGCKVETTLQTSDFSSLKGAKFDFDLAQATIPGRGGKWELTGYLIGREDLRQFLGRMATLVDPSGRVVAVADEITVSIDDPQEFKVKGSRLKSREVQAILKEEPKTVPAPASGRIKVQGCWIFTEKAIKDLNGDVIDFDKARAEIPDEGKIWVLMGHLILKQSERYFIVMDGRLIRPDGQTAAQASLLLVPIENPEKFRVLDKDPLELFHRPLP